MDCRLQIIGNTQLLCGLGELDCSLMCLPK